MVKTKRSLIAALIAVIWAITAVLFLIPNVSAQALILPLDITGGVPGTDYIYSSGGVITIKSPKEMTIRNADPDTPITDTIVVESGVSANITLAGVNIDVSAIDKCAFQIEDDSTGNVTITLADGSVNVLKSGYGCAGLQKNGSGSDIGKLTVQGGNLETGTLTAEGGSNAAGIGGGQAENSSNITIIGGIVDATGGDYGAGIGGGKGGMGIGGYGKDITIKGGIVTATGGYYGAGIGGGKSRNGSNIKISGGSVKATAGTDANAIGGGNGKGAVIPTDGSGKNVYLAVIDNPNNENVYIDGKLYSPQNHKAADSSDTKLYAYLTGKNRTVRVGNDEIDYLFSGSSLDVLATDLTISGDNLIYGTDYTYPASTGVLTILSDKKVTISGSTTKDTIVVGKNKDADITLDGVDINVSATYGACAFKIEYDSTGNVTITLADGSVNVLKSGERCAGLQKNGSSTDIGNLTISGTGKLTVTGGEYAAGIGGGCADSGSNITISGGTVTASGGYCGAGIGGGSDGNGTNITISSGIVTATGGEFGAGIGGGSDGNGTNITISGGTVTANSEALGASIGGGIRSSGSYITISGGSVKATASSSANAIGGGSGGNGAVTPTLADKTTPVYLLEIDNPNDETVFIDGKLYSPKNHKAADSTDTKLYAYLTGKYHTVKVGSTEEKYVFDSNTDSFVKLGTDLTITGDSLVYGTDYTYPASTGVLTILSDKEVTISGSTTKDTIIVVGQNKNADITLDGVDINVSGTDDACAFKIEGDSTGNVKITLADGSDNVLKSGAYCAGLQKNGSYPNIGKLTISGTGKLTAIGGYYSAGIGGGIGGSGSNITISGGIVNAKGGVHGAGIGGGYDNAGSNITISGGTVNATGGDFATGIGGGDRGSGLNIKISGGSVKATAGAYAPNAVGGGYGNDAVIPTDGTENVYLLEIDNPNGRAITINGSDFTPISHGNEKKVYAYLPAKTAMDPNTVTVGESTSRYYYDTVNSKWHGITDIPDADDTEFIYNGREQTYAIPESPLYTISGNKQTNAGNHTVTVALKDNAAWSDGTTEDKEYTFTIAKAQPELTVTAKPTSDIAGKTVTVTASAVNPNNDTLDDIPDIVLTYKIGDGDEISFTDSFVIPEGTAIGTIITVKAKTAEDGNYKSSEAETKVNVSDCTHDDVNAKWESDSTGHWHICNYCSEKVDFAAHTFGEWKITVPATETSDGKKVRSCTVCGYTEEETVKFEKTDAEKAAEEAEKALEEITVTNDTTAEDIISSINRVIGDDVTAEVTEIKKVPATDGSDGSITVVITITDSDGNTEEIEKVFVIKKLPESDKPQTVYYPISINGNVTADRSSAKAGDTVNVSTAFGYDIIVTSNGRQIARITEKGSFVMPNGSVHITVVQNDTFAVMSNAWNHSYVYSYDSDMNRIKISSDSKRGTVTIKLGSEYAGREFIIYKGRNSTKVKVTEGVLDENGTYSFKADDGRNYTLVIK